MPFRAIRASADADRSPPSPSQRLGTISFIGLAGPRERCPAALPVESSLSICGGEIAPALLSKLLSTEASVARNPTPERVSPYSDFGARTRIRTRDQLIKSQAIDL